jgi:hypothetical protein
MRVSQSMMDDGPGCGCGGNSEMVNKSRLLGEAYGC